MVNLLSAFKVKPLPNGRPVPKETVNWRIIALALFGAGSAVLFGYDLGFIGGVITLPAFQTDFDLTSASKSAADAFHSNVVSVFQAGATVGSIALCFAADKFGRRASLMANFILYLIGAAMMVGASGTAGVALVYTGRVLTGFSVGASTMLVPVYVAECSPPHIRGRMVGLYEVGVQFGTMVGFWIPYAILKTQKGTIQWRLPFALQLVPCGLCIIALCFLVETPRFLIRKHGEEKALKTLAYLRGLPENHEYVQYEFTSIVEQVQWENAARSSLGTAHTIRRTFGAGNARRLFTGCMIMIFFQMAGTNAVNYYSPKIFQTFGLSADSAKLFATGVYGVVRFVSTLIAMILFTDRFGRRSMIVVGGSVMAACMWIIGALAVTHPAVAGEGMSGPQLASIILIFVWAVAFCFSYAGIPWIYCSEIFPLDVRTLSMGICTAVHWIFNLVLAKSTPYIVDNCPAGSLYFIFASCTTVGALYEWFFMPETKGRTLEEIEEAFGGARAVSDPAERANIDKAEVGHVEEADKEKIVGSAL